MRAQKLDIDDVRTVQTKGSGPIMRGDEVLGYFFLYEVDKVKGGERVYTLKLTDANLEVLQTKRLTRDRTTFALSASFNGEAICLTLLNPKEMSLELIAYDRAGEQLGKRVIELDRKEFVTMQQLYNFNEENGGATLVQPVPNKGFLLYLPNRDKGVGYTVQFLPNSLKAKDGGWSKPSLEKRGKFQQAVGMSASEEVIITSISGFDSPMKQGEAISFIEGRSVADGSLLFEMIPGKGSPRMNVTNAFYDPATQTVALGGTYYKGDDNLVKDRSTGVAVQRIDLKGERLDNAQVSWDKAFAKVGRAKTEHLKRGGSIYVHRVMMGADGGLTAIGEYFDTEVSALGIASTVLAGRGGSSMKKIVLQDLFAFRFDADLEFVDATMYAKPQHDVELPQGAAMVSPSRLALMLDMFDWYDYRYSQSFPERDMYTIAYRSNESEKGKLFKQPKLNVATKYGDQEEPTSALFDGKTDATAVRYQPAKPGYVMVSEYFRKEKTVRNRLEKVD